MENRVSVDFTSKAIGINDKWYWFDVLSIDTIKDVLPEGLKDKTITYIAWNKDDPSQTGFTLSDFSVIGFETTEENYNKYVKPYADMWQEKKDAEDQEQEEAEAERNKFENRQARALTQLNSDFETVKERAHVVSSLGFTADANSTANENVNGLLQTIGTGTVQFCDYYNQFHELTKAQLETLQSEIIQNAQALYAQKWQYRTAIEACSNNEQLDEVTAGIKFTYIDFTPKTDTGEGATETDQTTEGVTE